MGYITKDGLKKLQDELHELKTHERPSISKQIAEARDKGDLSENAEYDAAKEAQGLLELKIAKLEEIVRSSKVIDESNIGTDCVQLLNKVRIQNTKNNAEMSYTIVGESEADLKAGKLSVATPIAKGLLGKKLGETATIKTPAGEMSFKILEISI
jgi:transcription elongation factor GreA